MPLAALRERVGQAHLEDLTGPPGNNQHHDERYDPYAERDEVCCLHAVSSSSLTYGSRANTSHATLELKPQPPTKALLDVSKSAHSIVDEDARKAKPQPTGLPRGTIPSTAVHLRITVAEESEGFELVSTPAGPALRFVLEGQTKLVHLLRKVEDGVTRSLDLEQGDA